MRPLSPNEPPPSLLWLSPSFGSKHSNDYNAKSKFTPLIKNGGNAQNALPPFLIINQSLDSLKRFVKVKNYIVDMLRTD